MKLRLADDLALPESAVTEKIAFLGRTGSGKTYAAMKLAEEMLTADAQVIALDPVGKWYGLRVAGHGPGFPIAVFGGLHGDYPLESTAGRLVADLLVERNLSAVLDVSQFTNREQSRFAGEFAEQFYYKMKASPSAVHVFLEECQEFVPQNPMHGDEKMLGAFERMWKLGRNCGIGGSLISQRPQEVNKKALNQTGTLIVFQMTGPQERKAIESWVSAVGVNEDITDLLPNLKKGQPHVWSPTFLNVSRTVQVAQKRTADVSETPGKSKGKERPLTPIDVKALSQAMAASVERAKADDPRELRAQIADLKRQIKTPAPAVASTKAEPAFRKGQLAALEKSVEKATALVSILEARARDVRAEFVTEMDAAALALSRAANELRDALKVKASPVMPTRVFHPTAPSVSRVVSSRVNHADMGVVTNKAHRAFLTALAQRQGQRLTRDRVALFAGYSVKSGHVDNTLGALRSAGYVEGGNDGIRITSEGVTALGGYVPLPTGRDLIEYWFGQLGKAENAMLRVLVDRYPKAIDRETLAEESGYSPQSGHVDNTLGRLRSLQLAEGRNDAIRANEDLFQ